MLDQRSETGGIAVLGFAVFHDLFGVDDVEPFRILSGRITVASSFGSGIVLDCAPHKSRSQNTRAG